MKELNSIEAEQVAGGGLLTSVLDTVVSGVDPLLHQVIGVAVPQAVSSVETATDSLFTTLF